MKWFLIVCVSCFVTGRVFPEGAPKNTEKVKTIEKKVEHKLIMMSIVMAQESVGGSSINLKITVRNGSKGDVEFWSRGKYLDYTVALLDAKKDRVALTQFGKVVYGGARLGGSGETVTLPAGKQMEATLNLARVFDLSVPGDYELVVSLRLRDGLLKTENMKFKVVEEPR